MNKSEIIKMELSDFFNFDCVIQNILDEGCEEVSSAIHSAYSAMSKDAGVDKEIYAKYKELALDPNLEKSIKLIILQSIKEQLDKRYNINTWIEENEENE